MSQQTGQSHHSHERAPSLSPGQPSAPSTGEPPHLSSRSFGIQGLINPSNPPSAETWPRETKPSPPNSTAIYQASSVGTAHSHVFTGHAAGSQPPAPPATTPLAQTPTERGSPATSYPFPALNNPSQTASPLSTHEADLSRGVADGYRGSSITPLPSPGSVPEEAYRTDHRGFEASSSEHGNHGHLAIPFPGARQAERPPGHGFNVPRAASQPLIPYPRHGSHMQHSHPAGPHSSPWAHPTPSYTQPRHPGSVPVSPSPSAAGSSKEHGTPLYRSVMSAAASGGRDGQPVLRMNTGGGEDLVITVDTNNASRQASEKRQRNANASDRFRTRKKDLAEFMEGELHDVKIRLQVAEQERDFYRAERARLRDLVLQSPLADQAAGPPSPTISSATMPESASSEAGASQPKNLRRKSTEPPMGRPLRRRRTKGPASQPVATYSPQASPAVTLPPLSGAYNTAERPPQMSPGVSWLPPLRAVEGQLGAQRQEPVPAQRGDHPPYPAYPRVQHEVGWVNQLNEQAGPYSPSVQGSSEHRNPYGQPRGGGPR